MEQPCGSKASVASDMESTPPVTAEGAPEPAQPEPVAADEAVKDFNMQAAAAPPADVQNTAGESSDLKQPEAAAEVPQAQGGEAAVEAEPAARESMQQETETPAVNSVSLANADVADDEEEIELEDDIEDMAAEEEQGLSVSASGLPADLAAIADLVAADVPSKPVGGDTEMCLKPVIAALPSGQSAGANLTLLFLSRDLPCPSRSHPTCRREEDRRRRQGRRRGEQQQRKRILLL